MEKIKKKWCDYLEQKFKDLEVNQELLKVLQDCYSVVLALVGYMELDIIKLDEKLSELDKDYNCKECTYKGQENVSLAMYIHEKFGEIGTKMIEKLI